jgi:hypothetical protein
MASFWTWVISREEVQNEVDNKVFLGKANFFNKSFCFCHCFCSVDGEARDGEGLGWSKDKRRRGGVDFK